MKITDTLAAVAQPGVSSRLGQSVLLCLTVASGAYSRVIVNPLQENMRVALAFSDNQMALLQGAAMAVALLLLSVPLGLLIDRYSRVRLLWVLSVLNIAASVGTAFAHSFAVIFLARCLVGAAGFAMVPVALSLLSDWVAPEQRGRSTMAVSFGQLAGSSAAFALGGFVIARLGDTAEGWRHALWWLSCPLIPLLFATLAAKEPPRSGRESVPGSGSTWSELWRYRHLVWPLLFGMAMLETALGAVLIWTAPLFSRVYALPADRIGAVIAGALLISGTLGPLLGGIVADLCQRAGGPRRTLSALSVFALAALPAGAYASMPDPVLASAVMIVFMTLVSAVAVLSMTLFTVVVPNELRGLCISVSIATNVLFALGLAPLGVSSLMSLVGGSGQIAWALTLECMATTAVGGVTFAWAARRYAVRAFPARQV